MGCDARKRETNNIYRVTKTDVRTSNRKEGEVVSVHRMKAYGEVKA
jgi:hypothetical protein